MKQDQTPFAAPRLSASQAAARRIAGAYQGDVADRVRRFLPMVRRLAWHVNGSGRPGIEVEDLVQAGLVALTECAQKHAGPTEDGFAAYAKMRVRGAMVDLIRRTVPLSRGASERRRQLAAQETALRGARGFRSAQDVYARLRAEGAPPPARAAVVSHQGIVPSVSK
jgi:RNA polymerase sigma factor for flagellar operon FliA